MTSIYKLLAAAWLSVALVGCGTSACKKDTDCKAERICNKSVGECVDPATFSNEDNNDNDAFPSDDAGAQTHSMDAGTENVWGCDSIPSYNWPSDDTFRFKWLCSVGDRELICSRLADDDNCHCKCTNIREGTLEGRFSDPDICTPGFGIHNVAYRANKHCSWHLPE